MIKLNDKYILETLGGIQVPDTKTDIVSAGMISGLQISPANDVVFMIEVDPNQGAALEPLRQRAEKAVQEIDGVNKVTVVLTAQKLAEPAPKRPASPDPHGMDKNPKLELPIRNIIIVASGKGGVGKSTMSVNLAAALAQTGLKTGLLDADIYGPSIPKMMGLEGQRPETNADNQIVPLEGYGLKLMSIGFMLQNKEALIWRGPMVQSAVYQMLRDVEWGSDDDPLDILIVDMPPGTGDAQLTMAQKVPVDAAVIVSTPQDIALIDARKAIEMFQKLDVRIAGVIENMSTYVCSNCGYEDHIFGQGGAKDEADKQNVPFLGAVPLHADIRLKSDSGTPFVLDDPGNASVQAIQDIAQRIKERLKEV